MRRTCKGSVFMNMKPCVKNMWLQFVIAVKCVLCRCIRMKKIRALSLVVLSLEEMVYMDTMNSVHKPHLSVQKNREVETTVKYFNTQGTRGNPSCLFLHSDTAVNGDWLVATIEISACGNWLARNVIQELHMNVDPTLCL